NDTRVTATLYYDTGAPVITGVALGVSVDSVIAHATTLDTAADAIYYNPVSAVTCTFTVSFTEPSPLSVSCSSATISGLTVDTQAAGGWVVTCTAPAGLAANDTITITVTDITGKTDTAVYVLVVDQYCPAVTLLTPA
ncbi:MAG TPA: hypothetical protein PKM88_10850, partial [bacterium]|nr:hypothetical protein [bacterium]